MRATAIASARGRAAGDVAAGEAHHVIGVIDLRDDAAVRDLRDHHPDRTHAGSGWSITNAAQRRARADARARAAASDRSLVTGFVAMMLVAAFAAITLALVIQAAAGALSQLRAASSAG
jgi:hypothetical protein